MIFKKSCCVTVMFGLARRSVTSLTARCWQDICLQAALGLPEDGICVMIGPHFAFLCIMSFQA